MCIHDKIFHTRARNPENDRLTAIFSYLARYVMRIFFVSSNHRLGRFLPDNFPFETEVYISSVAIYERVCEKTDASVSRCTPFQSSVVNLSVHTSKLATSSTAFALVDASTNVGLTPLTLTVQDFLPNLPYCIKLQQGVSACTATSLCQQRLIVTWHFIFLS